MLSKLINFLLSLFMKKDIKEIEVVYEEVIVEEIEPIIIEEVNYPKFKQPTTQELIERFGKPNETGSGYLVFINIPYQMRLAWDETVIVNRISCHKDIAEDLLSVFNDLLDYYGYEEIKRLRIDLYGGCFNYRRMRNGSSWSTHAFAVAIDLDPKRNKLRESSRTARFARPEYKPMIDIFYKHGFISLGVEKNYDWMHFQKRI